MTYAQTENQAFKRAVILSAFVHLGLFLLILISPPLPKLSRKGMIHYVNVITFHGGGGGGGGSAPGSGGEKLVETVSPARETLADLTTPPKIQEQEFPALRYPVEKPKKEPPPKKEKKTEIQKKEKTAPPVSNKGKASIAGPGEGAGSGLRIGLGGGTGSGGGVGSGDLTQFDLSTFPYAWYLQIIHDQVSSNWFTSRVSTGLSGESHTTVYFRIHRDGHISSVRIVESSGAGILDQSAIRAVQSSSFPALPADYKDEYLGIHLIFEHNR